MQRRITQVDQETGEILEGATLAVFYPKRQNGFQTKGWLAMSQGGLEALVNADLTRTGLRVLLYLLSRLDFENYINVSQAEMARALDVDRSNCHKAVGELVQAEVIVEGPKVGMHRTYRLNPSYGWKGSAQNHHKAIRERMERARMKVIE
jgi:hypothetical protein